MSTIVDPGPTRPTRREHVTCRDFPRPSEVPHPWAIAHPPGVAPTPLDQEEPISVPNIPTTPTEVTR